MYVWVHIGIILVLVHGIGHDVVSCSYVSISVEALNVKQVHSKILAADRP